MNTATIQGLGLLCFVLLFYASSPAQNLVPSPAENAPLPVDTIISAKTFAPSAIDLSPDGLWVAYTLSDPRRRKIQGRPSDQLSVFKCTGAPYAFADNDVLITNTKTSETINISAGSGANWGPSWSPDGKSLAFYSDRDGKAHVWLWQRSTGKLRPLTTAVVHVRFRFEKILWSPDSRQVVTKILGVGQTLDGCFDGGAGQRSFDPSSRTVYEAQVQDRRLPASMTLSLSDLAMLDVATGKLKRIVQQKMIVGYSLSPAGDKIAFSSPKRLKPGDQYLLVYDLVVVSLSDQRIETVSDFSPGIPSLPVSWSPDSRSLAFLSNRECFVWDLRATQPKKVTSSPPTGFSQPPLWDKEGGSIYLPGDNKIWRVSIADAKATAISQKWDRQIRSIISHSDGNDFWSPDEGRSLYVSTNDPQSMREGFYRLDPESGKFARMIESDESFNLALGTVSRKSDAMIFAAQSARREQNLWFATRDFNGRRQLTRLNPELERYRAGEARLIDYLDVDGKKLSATLLLPANYQQDKRYPLIVWVYGGSMLSANVNHYGSAPGDRDNMQLFSTRGYAVLLPDSPLRVGSPMQDLAKTVLPAVDKAIAIGVADPDRLGIMGLSYGGYSTLALISQTTRFKAAVMGVGFGNLISSYGQMLKSGMPFRVDWAEEGQGRMGGPPWEVPERYVQNSPVFFLNKIQTPLLITQGGMDVSPYQSDEIFVGLRRLGKNVVYVRYENEGHGIEEYSNKIDYWNRVIGWFRLHLNTEERSAPSAR